MSPGWSNYYFLIGSAAAGLIGLMFVVVTLTAGGDRSRSLRGAAIYLTPTIVHFAAVFSISAVTQAPGLDASEAARDRDRSVGASLLPSLGPRDSAGA